MKNSNLLGGMCILDGFRKHRNINQKHTSSISSPIQSPSSFPYIKSLQTSSKFQSPPEVKELSQKAKGYGNNLDNL